MNLKPEEVFLAQGTLRPDLIESASLVASGKAELIKTHHNDTELIRKLREEVKTYMNFPIKPLFFPPLTIFKCTVQWFSVCLHCCETDFCNFSSCKLTHSMPVQQQLPFSPSPPTLDSYNSAFSFNDLTT